MNQREWRWSPREKQCLFLLQQRNTKATLIQIHAFMIQNALQTNINLLTKLITTVAAVDSVSGISHARRIFDFSPRKNDTFLCNTMIKSHLNTRQYNEATLLYTYLLKNVGFKPDNYTFSSLAKCCGLNLAFWEGLGVHNHVLKSGFVSNLYVGTSLVDMYGKFREMGFARKVFDEMPERSSVSWTALIDGYLKSGDVGAGMGLFYFMPEKDVAAYNVMIDAHVKMGEMGLARSLFETMPERNVVSWTSMIDGYCTIGDVDEARLLFDAMPERNLFSWNAMIGGYCQNKRPHEALRLFHELQMGRKFEPDDVTLVSVLPAIADLGALGLGNWVYHFARKKKLDKSSNLCTALVDMYAKCGEIEKARGFFDGIQVKETSIWNALVNGLAVNGRAEEALGMFSEMKSKGFKPNEVTMLGVLSACNHGGLVKEGRRWFKAMEEFGLTPRIEHYGCLVDLLGRAGCLDEAESLIDCMPYEANGIVLSSFLFACYYAKDIPRAERVIRKAIDMEPLNDGNYIMLRNLYASERRWNDVEEIKGLMNKKGAKKEIGYSVIEINGNVYEFVAGDKLHPESSVIHLALEHLQLHMKAKSAYFSELKLIEA
ncbi:hypothetical protein ACH5RR_023771 [Cinchona calisaya]|uniref:Chlororespiratory reduction 2 n=1 Tax=Cinchona calisaya TaxID=153742 RepID=A0ABD2ZBL8_9GENT